VPLVRCKFNEIPLEDEEENLVGKRWLKCGILIEKAWEVK